MIKTVAQTKVSEIFAIDNRKVYQIPKYQREYTWSKTEWEALFNDVIENELGYFLGSFICVNKESLQEITMEVIDGQQRFTTIVILLSVLYKKMSVYSDLMDDEDRNDLANLRSEIAIKERIDAGNGRRTIFKPKLFLQKQNQNDEDIAYLLYETGVITGPAERPKNYGYRRISKASQCFEKMIDDELLRRREENPELSETSILFDIEDKFNSTILVGIEVDTNKDAFMLFESLNHRGVPLTSLDLIKNTLISRAESNHETDSSYEKWKQILQNVNPDNYSIQERFFRQYYNAFRDDLNEPVKEGNKGYYFGYLATRTSLIEIYEKLINYDYGRLLDDLHEKSRLYAIIINNSDEEKIYSENLKELERIAGAPSYILLLYLLAKQNEMELTDKDIDDIVRVLITFFVRRNITDVPGTRKLIQMFMNIVSFVKNRRSGEVIYSIRQILKSESASDSVFEEKVRGPIYDDNPDATRYILCAIEKTYRTKEIHVDLWKRDNTNKYIWTIEHVFPEGERIPNAWVDMIAGGDAGLARQYRTEYVHTLGNLTITGFNSNLSNMSFENKRDRKISVKDRNILIGYRNGLYLNSDIVNEESWTIEKIQKRTEKLVKAVMGMFRWGDSEQAYPEIDEIIKVKSIRAAERKKAEGQSVPVPDKKTSELSTKLIFPKETETITITEVLEDYKKVFKSRFREQKYIWEAPNTFRNVWNLETDNLSGMIERATKDAEVILETGLFHPRNVLIELSKINPEIVRAAFKRLFNEEEDLQERCKFFYDEMEKLGSLQNINKGKTYQGYNAMSTYLWMRYPDKYYFYKYSVNTEVAKRFGLDVAGLREPEYTKMITGFQMFDQIRNGIAADNELCRIKEEMMTDNCCNDDEGHCLTMDFCFFVRPLYDKRKDKNRVNV